MEQAPLCPLKRKLFHLTQPCWTKRGLQRNYGPCSKVASEAVGPFLWLSCQDSNASVLDETDVAETPSSKYPSFEKCPAHSKPHKICTPAPVTTSPSCLTYQAHTLVSRLIGRKLAIVLYLQRCTHCFSALFPFKLKTLPVHGKIGAVHSRCLNPASEYADRPG